MTTIGYLVPEFPGQTHNFFWREIEALGVRGVSVELFSTRRPPPGIASPTWAARARAKTCYLFPLSVSDLFGALLWTVLAGPIRWWHALRVVAMADGLTLKGRLRMLGLILLGTWLGRQMHRRGLTHVHVHSCADAANIALFAHLMCGVTYSLTLHNPVSEYGPNQRAKWANARFAIVIAQWILDDLHKTIGDAVPDDLAIAPMGVNTDVFRRSTEYSPRTGEEPLRVFCCARLNPGKGFLYLLKAVSQLNAAGHPTQLRIAGEDDLGGTGYRKVLEQAIAEHTAADQIQLLGAISEDMVRAELETTHVFALASLEEPLGVALMEAMSMQVPVVATNAGGVPELVCDGLSGLLVPPGDASALAAALWTMGEDPLNASRMSTEARARIESSFSHRISATAIADRLGQL